MIDGAIASTAFLRSFLAHYGSRVSMSGFAAPGVLAAASKLAWYRRPRGYRPSGTPTASNRGTAADRIRRPLLDKCRINPPTRQDQP